MSSSTKKSNMRLISSGEPALHDVFDGSAIPTAYKIGYILNFYREPSFRVIEMEHGLTRPEIVALIFLNCRDGASATEICEYSGHLKASMSRAVIALEKKGLIQRRPDAADNRRQQLFLTDAGRALYAAYVPGLKRRESAMLACLSPSELGQFNTLLEKLARHVPSWASVSEL
jgi:DNA-binding MarR family transcriptional regulator